MKKTLTLALALIMAFVFSVTTTFASNLTDTKYVAIGASTANGFRLNGYNEEGKGINASKVTTSYPRLFQAELGVTEENYTNLCPEGLRTNEIRALLDDEYYQEQEALDITVNKDAFLVAHLNAYKDIWGKNSIADLRQMFKDQIASADIITLDACENNFGTYLTERLSGGNHSYRKMGTYNQTIYDITDIPEKVRTAIKKAEDKTFELVKELGADTEQAKAIVDALSYCSVASCVNFNATVEKIYALNPDVELIVFGVSNPLEGLKVKVDVGEKTIKLNFGKVVQSYLDITNNYIQTINKKSNTYKYANCKHYTTFADELQVSTPTEVAKQCSFVEYTGHGGVFKDSAAVAQMLSGKEAFINLFNGTHNTLNDYTAAVSGGITDPDLGMLIHPTVQGHKDKYDALLKAHSSNWSARKTYYKNKRTNTLKTLSKYSKVASVIGDYTEYLDSFDVHNMVYVKYKAATTEAEGHKAYWKCTSCGKIYLDKNGKKETTLDAVKIAKLQEKSIAAKVQNALKKVFSWIK